MIRHVTIKLEYDTKETWDKSVKDLHELMLMMNNLSRKATVIDISPPIRG